jgi:hypothetical protein
MMEEFRGGGAKEWGMENFSIESIREVVYIVWKLGERVSWGDTNI